MVENMAANEKSNPNADFFYKTILQLKTEKECKAFFDDLCTVNEIAVISQRLQAAKLLCEKHTYNDIVKMTGISTATISRVNRALQFGNGGFDKAFGQTNTPRENHEK